MVCFLAPHTRFLLVDHALWLLLQGCRCGGCRGGHDSPPPILVGEGGRSYPPHYYLAPQIFKPSYGPVSYNVALWFRILGYVQLMILLILSHSSTCLYVVRLTPNNYRYKPVIGEIVFDRSYLEQKINGLRFMSKRAKFKIWDSSKKCQKCNLFVTFNKTVAKKGKWNHNFIGKIFGQNIIY